MAFYYKPNQLVLYNFTYLVSLWLTFIKSVNKNKSRNIKMSNDLQFKYDNYDEDFENDDQPSVK